MEIIPLAYENAAGEIGMKTFDYSRKSIGARWGRGYQDGTRLIVLSIRCRHGEIGWTSTS
ncbi:DUF3734 domain-containing protein [Rhizobium leguminosarum]|uniref:DUF3734 domain-containing protein n=1 Tax=Rhizobium TaxID=379 RepID=UPI001C9283C8|nr:DUF3734 domain-containing protein [Rhizobium leguminosarum]